MPSCDLLEQSSVIISSFSLTFIMSQSPCQLVLIGDLIQHVNEFTHNYGHKQKNNNGISFAFDNLNAA